MNLAAWAPTVVSLVTAIFIAGMMYGTQKDHAKKLAAHDERFIAQDERFERLAAKESLQDVALAKLEAWRDGYNAATSQRTGA